MKKAPGFTLIEILIALMVFAVISAITASAMYYAFDTRSRINDFADKLSKLQLAINLINQDTDQIINRPVRGNEMREFPPFVGQQNYVEFTRTGIVNPAYALQRSDLKRVALLCKGDQLIRRSWMPPDTTDRMKYEDRVLLDKLTRCEFSYRDNNRNEYKEWREYAITSDQRQQPFPITIGLDIELEEWGSMQLVFLVPEALYVQI